MWRACSNNSDERETCCIAVSISHAPAAASASYGQLTGATASYNASLFTFVCSVGLIPVKDRDFV